MIIVCPCDQKSFNIDDKLIPKKGRLVKCGVCNHTWFFKPTENIEKKQDDLSRKIVNGEDAGREFTQKNKYLPAIKKEKSKNFTKLFLVVLISIIATVILIDTFKAPLSYVIPNINFYLNNLYQSLLDIKLFTTNLFN